MALLVLGAILSLFLFVVLGFKSAVVEGVLWTERGKPRKAPWSGKSARRSF